MDAFKAALPAGPVIGAPKVRAREIIDAIEPTRSGPYADKAKEFSENENRFDPLYPVTTARWVRKEVVS